MAPPSYSVPAYPVQPGAKVPKSDFVTIHSMPVKSLITSPQSGETLTAGTRSVRLRGHAWAGDRTVKQVDVTHDFGKTWTPMTLHDLPNPYSWATWEGDVTLPTHGYYEVWARATDDSGDQQPFSVDWNPKGYLNNAMHRIAVFVPAA